MIPFAVPSEFLPKVASGELIRYGAILKDADTGMIVGHLKEAGDLAQNLSSLTPIGALSQAGQHYQLAQIQNTLDTLQMISSVGALASVATFGICVAGFSVVNKKLNQLNAKLDGIIERIDAIREIVEKMNIKWETITLSKLQTASEQLSIAQGTKTASRRNDLLERSCHTFIEFKNYYLNIIEHNDIWTNSELPVNAATEMYSRFITCCLGQLYSEFLLGDMSSFKTSWKIVNEKVAKLSKFDKLHALRARTDRIASDIFSVTTADRHQIAAQINEADSIATETCARIDTMIVEAEYLEKKGLEPFSYIEELRGLQSDIILIPLK